MGLPGEDLDVLSPVSPRAGRPVLLDGEANDDAFPEIQSEVASVGSSRLFVSKQTQQATILGAGPFAAEGGLVI